MASEMELGDEAKMMGGGRGESLEDGGRIR